MTKLHINEVSDKDFENVKRHFSDKEVSDLTMAIGIINLGNRLQKSAATTPGAFDKMMGLDKAGLN